MRSGCWLIIALAVGCSGGNDKDDTADEVVPTDFGAAPSATASATVATVDPVDTRAWEAVNTLWAAVAISSTDVQIHGLMSNNAPAAGPPPAGGPRGGPCWEVQGVFPASKSVVFDTPCQQLQIYGKVDVDDLPSGPMRMRFSAPLPGEEFELDRRNVLGALRFAPVGQTRWTIGGGEPTSAAPGPSPVVVIDDVSHTVDLEARGQALFGSSQLAFWGIATVSTTTGSSTLRFGATTDAQAESLTSSPASSRYDFFPASCRCASAGSSSFASTTLTLTEVVVDLDDLKATDDGRDDPAISLTVDVAIPGELLIAPSGERCGGFVAQFAGNTTEITVPGQALAAAIDDACTFRDINDADACDSLRAGAALVTEVTVSVGDLLNDAAARAFEGGINRGWCDWPLPQ